MAEEVKRNETDDEPRRRGGMAGGGAAVADEGDVPFAIMATIGVLIGLIVALGAGGFFSGLTPPEAEPSAVAEVVEEEEAVVEEPAEEEEAPATTEAPTPDPADATVAVSADGIVLSGTVPDQATADALLDEALLSFPETSITNDLVVVDGAEPYTLTVSGEAADGTTFDQVTGGFDALAAPTRTI